MKKRLLSALLALVMVCTLLPVAAWAAYKSGLCGAQGDNATWELSYAISDTNFFSLSIYGSGDMTDYDITEDDYAPWYIATNNRGSIVKVAIADGITHIGNSTFAYSAFPSVDIPQSVTSIGDFAFTGCFKLSSVSMPNTVASLGDAVFYRCSKLTSIELGSRLSTIGRSCFESTGLTAITLPARVTSIGEQAFASCEDLKYIVITGTNLRSIGANAFKNCISLTDIYFKGSQAQWNRIAIDSSNVALKRAVIHYNYDGTTAPTLATPVMTLSRDTSADKPRISWNSVDGAAQYEIYRSTDNVSFSIIRRTTGLSYTDTTAAAGTTYYYKVRAINGTDISLFCASQSIKSPAVPSVPTMTLTTDRSGKPVLNWTSVKDASDYEIYRSTTGAAGSYKIVRRTSGLTWTDTSTEMNKTYYYVVRAKNGNLCGKFCAAKSVKCPIILSAPTMTLDLDRSANKPVISWPAVPFAAQYEIYRSTTGAAGSYKIIRRTSGLTYTDTTAASGTTYYYTVRAMRSTASGTIYSSFCKVQSTLPAVPTMTLQVNSTTGLPVISWKKASSATQYEVYRSDTGAAGSFRIIRRTIGLSYTDTTAEAGHTYYYVVRGMQGTSPHIFYGKFCPAQSIQCTAVPDVPVMTLTNDSDTGKPVISWSKTANAAQYEVFRSTDGSNFSIVRRTIHLTWTDPNTEAGVTYYYKVRAINGSVKGAFCETQSLQCAVIPGAPALTLTNDSDTGSAIISWNSVDHATEYEVYRSADGESYQLLHTTSDLTYTDPDTESGITYYKVRSKNGSVNGTFCAPQSIAIPGVPVMTLSINSSTRRNVVSWSRVDYATEYEVFRNDQLVLRTTGLTYTDLNAYYGSTYFYKVRAIRETENGTIYGQFCAHDSLWCRYLDPVTGLTLSYDPDTRINVLRWNSVFRAEWYSIYRSTDGKDYTLLTQTKTASYDDFNQLKAGTTYYYKIYAGAGNAYSPNGIVTSTACAPQSIKCKVTTVDHGELGNCTWLLLGDATLFITGTGDLPSVYSYPWSSYPIKRVVIRPGITSIGNSMFNSCSALTSVTIPDSVTSIGNWAFEDCTSLTNVTIPDSVTSIGYGAFKGCTSLTGITIPDGVTSIGDYAFYQCSSLTSITIPDGVTSIGTYAFYKCTSLSGSIKLPDSVTVIGKGAFADCERLTSVTLSSGMTGITNSAFSGCSNLTTVMIPESIASIETAAFDSCYRLSNITLPDSLTSIGTSAFYYCYRIKEFKVSAQVTSIASAAFFGCNGSVNVAENNPCYTSVNGVLFDKKQETLIYGGGVSGSYVIPSSVTSISLGAFSNCKNLTSVTIPEGITTISQSAFCQCSSLYSVAIPRSVATIRNYAFMQCDSLNEVYYAGSKADWSAISIYSDNSPLNSATILYNQTEPWR